MNRATIEIPEDRIREFCERHGILQLSLFGSVLREDFGPESDVDMLIRFAPGRGAGFIRLGMMEEELSLLLGRRVDLHTVGLLSPYFRDEVLREAETIYVAA